MNGGIWIGAVALVAAGLASCRGGADRIAARVNGQAILQEEIDRGIPPGLGRRERESLRLLKLEVMVETLLRRRFLAREGVVVDEASLDEAMAQLRRSPPLKRCGCCAHRSLESFLRERGLTEEQYRGVVRAGLAMDAYLKRAWVRKKEDGAGFAAWVDGREADVRSDHVKILRAEVAALHRAPPPGRAAALRELEEARARRDGEGAGPGEVVLKLSLPRPLVEALAALPDGSWTGPVEIPMGYGAYKKLPMGREDVLSVLEAEFERRTLLEALRRIEREARVEITP